MTLHRTNPPMFIAATRSHLALEIAPDSRVDRFETATGTGFFVTPPNLSPEDYEDILQLMDLWKRKLSRRVVHPPLDYQI